MLALLEHEVEQRGGTYAMEDTDSMAIVASKAGGLVACPGGPTQPLPFENRPAVGRISISSPAVMRSLESLNEGRPYGQQLKPFNFLLTCHVRVFGHPTGVDANRFHLIPLQQESQTLDQDRVDRSIQRDSPLQRGRVLSG